MRKNKFLAALAIAACLATSVPLSASAATLGQAATASEVTYSKVTVADQAKVKEVYVAADYAELNPDLVAAGLSGDALFNHFITSGIFEGRQANKNFNVAVYKSAYADLQQAFGNDIVAYYVHYATHGKAEGRSITTVDAAKSNGVVVKSLFSDKVILDKVVAAPASSSSSSNSGSGSGSSTPTPSEEGKTDEEKKPETEYSWVDRDSSVDFNPNLKNGSTTAYKYSGSNPFTTALATTTAVSTALYAEAKFMPDVDFSYNDGVFYNYAAGKIVLGTLETVFDDDNFYEIGGAYYPKHDIDDAFSNTVRRIGGTDGWKCDVALPAGDKMDIAVGYPNNENTGIINEEAADEVSAAEAVADGINPNLWWKDSTGLYHKIVSEKRAHRTDDGTAWNFKKNSGGNVLFSTEGAYSEVFYSTTPVQTEDCFVVKETGYLRIEDNNKNANTYVSLKNSNNAVTISEAGKTGINTYATTGTNVTYKQALVKGLSNNYVNGINVKKVRNEYVNVDPAAGYVLRTLGGELVAYRYTEDYKLATDVNNKYMQVGGLFVERDGVSFTADAIANAHYVKAGYIRFNGKYYKEIAYTEDNSSGWMKVGYVIKENWNKDKGAYCTAESTNYNLCLKDRYSKAPEDPGKRYIRMPFDNHDGKTAVNGWQYCEVVSTADAALVGFTAAPGKYVMDTTTGRFYIQK